MVNVEVCLRSDGTVLANAKQGPAVGALLACDHMWPYVTIHHWLRANLDFEICPQENVVIFLLSPAARNPHDEPRLVGSLLLTELVEELGAELGAELADELATGLGVELGVELVVELAVELGVELGAELGAELAVELDVEQVVELVS